MSVSFWVAGQPSLLGHRSARLGYTPREVLDWRQDVVFEYRQAAMKLGLPLDGEYTKGVHVSVRALGCLGDVDNFGKGVMDALLGVAYLDDAQVLRLVTEVDGRELTEKGRPRRPKNVVSGVWVTLRFLGLEAAP